MKKLAMAAAFCLLTPKLAFAAPETKVTEKSVNELMTLTNVDRVIESIYGQMDQMMAGMAQQMGIQPSEQATFDQYMNKLSTLIRQEVTWEKLKTPMMAVYIDNFTQKEIDDMVAFYKTESGRSMISKMPAVMQQSMQISQQKMMALMPQVREMAMEFEKQIQAQRTAPAQ
jgi:hypothetical protein